MSEICFQPVADFGGLRLACNRARTLETSMFNQRAMRGWRQMFVNQGIIATLRTATRRVLGRLSRSSPHVNAPVTIDHPAIHSFDQSYGVETSGLIWGEKLTTGSASDQWNTAYYGIAPSVFRKVLSQIESALPGAAFVDLGSGKGRAVMLAMSYPFHIIYGVELSPDLHAIAENNLQRYSKMVPSTAQVRLICMDALEFEFPPTPLILFFYHPFCRPVLQKVLNNLERSLRMNPRPARLVYINTELQSLLDSSRFLRRIFEATIPMSPEDQLDDRVGSTQEECAIYESTL